MRKKNTYHPPHTLTPAILRLVAEIGMAVGRLSVETDTAKSLKLHRLNRIRTIHGSLAIEGNTLSVKQITAILDGKRVIASPREILEARNAVTAYKRFEQWRPHVEEDLLEAHRILMTDLIEQAGTYRHGGVGVMAGERVIHMAPPSDRVPTLMAALLNWIGTTDQHPLVAGSVFHYEFEFIHPFADGNGRMGRLWQTLILSRWNSLFTHIPVESLIHDHQAEYYRALGKSTEKTDSAPFIEFMLRMILDAVSEAADSQVAPNNTPPVTPSVTPPVMALLQLLVRNGELGAKSIREGLKLKDRRHVREAYINPALKDGLIEMTLPGKPKSRMQKYRLTETGRREIELF